MDDINIPLAVNIYHVSYHTHQQFTELTGLQHTCHPSQLTTVTVTNNLADTHLCSVSPSCDVLVSHLMNAAQHQGSWKSVKHSDLNQTQQCWICLWADGIYTPSAFLQVSEMHHSATVQFSFFESCPMSGKQTNKQIIATVKILLECRGLNNRSANCYHWYGRLDTRFHRENTEVFTPLSALLLYLMFVLSSRWF